MPAKVNRFIEDWINQFYSYKHSIRMLRYDDLPPKMLLSRGISIWSPKLKVRELFGLKFKVLPTIFVNFSNELKEASLVTDVIPVRLFKIDDLL